MSATHELNLTFNLSLDPAPTQQAGFGTQLHLVDQAAGNTLDGDRWREYADLTEVQTDVTAGFLTAAALAKATAVFSQRPKPAAIRFGRVDTGGAETYADALAACIADDDGFYGVSADSRADADILALATPVEALEKILCVQSDDATWLTSGLPAGLTALAGKERSIVCYHDEDAEPMAEGYLSNRLVFNPDTQSAPWDAAPVKGVSAYTAALTTTQRTLAIGNNANVGLPYDGENFVVDPGVNCAGRQIHEILTADWYIARVRALVATEKVKHSGRGEKIGVTKTGQSKIASLLAQQLAIGVAAGHFVRGQTEVLPQTITSTDLSSGKLRFKVRGQLVSSARLFEFDINFSRDPITEE